MLSCCHFDLSVAVLWEFLLVIPVAVSGHSCNKQILTNCLKGWAIEGLLREPPVCNKDEVARTFMMSSVGGLGE